MTPNLGKKIAGIFWKFLMNLIEIFQEARERFVGQKLLSNVKRTTKNNMNGAFFLVVLKREERLLDFSIKPSRSGGVRVAIQRGQYRLERKIVRWGSSSQEMQCLVLENTTIGALENWWQSRVTLGRISLKLAEAL